MWLPVAEDMWELPLGAPPGLSMGQSLFFFRGSVGRESGPRSIRGELPCVDPLLFHPQTPGKSTCQGWWWWWWGWLKCDASCARPGDPSERKPEGRAGSGRGAGLYVSCSGGSARLSARTASRSRPMCRHMASPLEGEETMSAIVCPTPPSGPPLHLATLLCSALTRTRVRQASRLGQCTQVAHCAPHPSCSVPATGAKPGRAISWALLPCPCVLKSSCSHPSACPLWSSPLPASEDPPAAAQPCPWP